MSTALDVRAAPVLRPGRPVLTYIGFGTVALGNFVLLFTWGEVAGLDNVALQMPYVVSGGSVGLGIILSGLVMVLADVVRRDATSRDHDLQELHEALAELKVNLGGETVRSNGSILAARPEPGEPEVTV